MTRKCGKMGVGNVIVLKGEKCARSLLVLLSRVSILHLLTLRSAARTALVSF